MFVSIFKYRVYTLGLISEVSRQCYLVNLFYFYLFNQIGNFLFIFKMFKELRTCLTRWLQSDPIQSTRNLNWILSIRSETSEVNFRKQIILKSTHNILFHSFVVIHSLIWNCMNESAIDPKSNRYPNTFPDGPQTGPVNLNIKFANQVPSPILCAHWHVCTVRPCHTYSLYVHSMLAMIWYSKLVVSLARVCVRVYGFCLCFVS